MTTFSDNRTAVRVNTLLKQKMVSTDRPGATSRSVCQSRSVDAVARTADVVYVGDPPDNIVTVPFGSAQAHWRGPGILITGGKHNRYISALRGRSQTRYCCRLYRGAVVGGRGCSYDTATDS